LIAVPVIILK